MTPEMAEYYRAMLLVGLHDRFDQYFDKILETEDPLPDLILSLCTCISDRNQVLSILHEYTLNHPYDDDVVCELVLRDIREQYDSGKLSRVQVSSILYDIVMQLDKLWVEPWHSLTGPSYYLELCDDGLIDEEVFAQCFDAWYLRNEKLDAWELQRQRKNHKTV